MVIDKLSDFEGFLEVVEQCKGDVELVTPEGDRLNLKSKLSQFVSLANIFQADESIPELELIAYEPDDAKKLLEFMINQ